MPFDTQPRDGAPSTVDILPAQWEIWLSPIGLPYVAPLFALMVDKTITVSELCSVPPPEQERWTINDVVASLVPETKPLMEAKLLRMAHAAIWDTYCEYVPPEPTGLPQFIANDAFQRLITAPTYFPDQIVMTTDNVDLWVLVTHCITPSSNGQVPYLKAGDPNDATDPSLGVWNNTAGVTLVSAIAVGSTWPNPAGSGPAVGFTPSGYWRVRTNAPNGQWGYAISAWNLDGRGVVPRVEPWAPAPIDPQPYQFSQECVDAICLMANNYPPAATDLSAVNTKLDAILAALEPPPGTELVAGPSVGEGGTTMAIPEGMVGAAISVTAPASVARIGESPLVQWNCGYVAVGRDDAWHPSERLKHPIQLVYPFPAGVTDLAIDLSIGCTAQIAWLAPS